MNTSEVKDYFDQKAQEWDDTTPDRSETIAAILSRISIQDGQSILDVGCGTGVMIPYYLNCGARDIIGIDLSEKMIDIARAKFPEIRFICDDVVTAKFDQAFDQIVIYNAFPHFTDPIRLIEKCISVLKEGGRFSIAHGMSRDKINAHHDKVHAISNGLMEAEKLKELYSPYLIIDQVIDDDKMYLVSGIKK